MRVIKNPKNLIPNNEWLEMRKVRVVVINDLGYYAISIEGGKCIFPGGKCEPGEDNITAIKRELKEEMGIDFETLEINILFELETFYDDMMDYRSGSIKPRHTITTYYYIKTHKNINVQKMHLTEDEKNLNFNIAFVPKEKLLEMIMQSHAEFQNGKFFDEENKTVMKIALEREKN